MAERDIIIKADNVYKEYTLGSISGRSFYEELLRRKNKEQAKLPVGTGFHPELSGRENIYINGTILGMTRKEIDSKIEDIIAFSEIREFIDTPVKRYSSGMYVKLAFAVAAYLESDIMILDEVLAVGDMKFQKKCLDKMQELSSKEGRTVLCGHDQQVLQALYRAG